MFQPPPSLCSADLIKFYCLMVLGFYPWPIFVALNFFFGRFLGRFLFRMSAQRLLDT